MGKPTTIQTRPRILPQQKLLTRDGVELCTDVFLPESTEAAPVVVVRTPYGRSQPFLLKLAVRLNQSGYGVALQDCRGRYQSQGELDWLLEENDTRDTLSWLAAKDFSDGRFALVGMSISSHPCFTVAADPPAGTEVSTVINAMGVVDFRSLFYQQDALVLHWALPWVHAMDERRVPARMATHRPWSELYRHLPVSEMAEQNGDDGIDFWKDVSTRPADDPFWRQLDASAPLDEIDTPTLHLAGWYDFLVDQSLTVYERARAAGRHPEGHQKLVVGPWDHQSLFTGKGEGPIDLQALIIAWCERWMRIGKRSTPGSKALEREPDAMAYVMGAGTWVGLDGWPDATTFNQDLYLSSTSGANTARGDGVLQASAPDVAGSDRFDYDPADPVPTRGGVLWPFADLGLEAGRADQAEIEARPDVLVYTTPPLAEDLILVGRVAVDLWASSSAPTTDFTAKLVHVDGDGVARIVCDGIARTHLRGDGPEQVRVGLRGTGQRFPEGHRLRLEISSSNFPQYDRALNGDPSGGTVAHQTIFHGGEHASRLSFHALAPAELEKRSCELLDVRATGLLGASLGARVATATKSRFQAQQQRLFDYLSEQFGQPKGLFGRAVGLVLLNMNREINRWTVDQIDVKPDDRTLEIGFGPGYALREVSKHIRGGLATGIDHSDLMYEAANRRNATAIRDGRVKLIQSPFDDVDIDEGSIDKVYAVNSIQIWPKPVESMKRLRKVLKPGGLIALTLRPTWVRTEQQVRSLGLERIRQLRAAGFTDARLVIKQTPGVVTFCALATNGPA